MSVAELREALAERCVTDPQVMESFLRDSSAAVPAGLPLALVLAGSTEDVSAALRWASAHRVPVSVRGAGTGLVGGATAYPDGLIISLERMNRVLSLNASDRYAIVQPGVITADLDAAARAEGLFFPPDPASARISTVGGNIATNAGGLRCLAHGVTRDAVSGVQVVLADGRVIRTGGMTRKNVTGYDLTSLFVGSEGTLGIITEATVRLLPVPPGEPRTFRADFRTMEAAGEAVLRIVNSDLRLEALELMDALSVEIIESFYPTGLSVPEGAMLIGQTVGFDAEADALACVALCRSVGAVDTAVSTSDTLLEARRMSNPALTARGLKLSCDVGVPISKLPEIFTGITALGAQHRVRVSTVAHAGDGNLHSTVELPEDPGGEERARAAMSAITRLALELGGTITGEHGIGSLRRDELPWQLDEGTRSVQRAIKAALDPQGILTPGRAI